MQVSLLQGSPSGMQTTGEPPHTPPEQRSSSVHTFESPGNLDA